MKLSQEHPENKFYIQRYERGSITINNQSYAQSLIITPNMIISDWRPHSFQELTANDFNQVLQLAPQIVLLGTGNKQYFPDHAILADLYRHNIGVEVMDTGAACRTFNLLLSEHRNVLAALIIGN